jgi:lysine-specific histone demethylase 1
MKTAFSAAFLPFFAIKPTWAGFLDKAFGRQTKKTSEEAEILDCLILGGGIAGMTAANALAYPRSEHDPINSRPRSVLVLEGQGRLGGRVFTKQVKGFPESIELGAQYIHVDDKKNTQGCRYSLWKAFEEYAMSFKPINRLRYGVLYSKKFQKLRRHWEVICELPLGWLLSFRQKITDYSGPDMSLKQWLEHGPRGSKPEGAGPNPIPFYDEKQKPLADLYLSGPLAGPLDQMSLAGFNLDRLATLDEGDHEYKIVPGWSYFVEMLKYPLRTFLPNPFIGAKIPIRYHSKVVRIDYQTDHVEVTVQETQNAKPGPAIEGAPITERVYRAKTAIVTFPVGILRRAAGIDPKTPNDLLEFHPPLPEKKLNALRAIGVGVAAKLFIVFESRFWDEEIGLINRVDGMSSMGRTYFVPNYGNEKTNTVLAAYLGAEEVQRIADWSEERILKSICEELGEIFFEANQQKKIHDRVSTDPNGSKIFAFKNWAQDCWSYGNDSYLIYEKENPVISEAMPTARRELASAAETGGLHWAGDSTVYADGNDSIYAPAHPGFTHGAHTSGLRAAKEVAAFLN